MFIECGLFAIMAEYFTASEANMRSSFFALVCGIFLTAACGGSDEPAPKAYNPPPVKQAAPTPPPPPPPPPPSGDANTADGADAPSGDCPAAMAEYDKFVDQYVSYMKKAANGDVTALAEVSSLMSQAEKIGGELAATQGDLSVDCLKRYNEINKKMTDAAMEMSGASAADKADLEEAQEAADEALETMGCAEECQKITDPTAMLACLQGCM
jgi:Tfp pilus assembly major pilin PilA